MTQSNAVKVVFIASAFVNNSLALGDDTDSLDARASLTKWTQAEQEKGYVVFTHSTLQLMPSAHVPRRKTVAEQVSVELARGEYESVQIGVHALGGPLDDVKIEVESDLAVQVYHLAQTKGPAPDKGLPTWAPPEAVLVPGNTLTHVAPGHSGGFWLTFHAGRDARAGDYTGRIRIQCPGKPATELALNLRVRSFELASPRIAFGMYFHRSLIPSFARTDEWLGPIYRDMAAHGQTSVSFYEGGDFSTLPPKSAMADALVPAASETDLLHRDIPCMFLQSNVASLVPNQRRAAVAWLEDQRDKQGWPEMIVYGWDEPGYPRPGLRKFLLPMRDVPVRILTAMGAKTAYGHGDLHDVWVVMGGAITPQMRAEAARMGTEVWTYSYHIWRKSFLPYRQRFYAGLYTWANELRGNYVWDYHHEIHSHVWFREDRDEPMPLVGWEARREGIDDFRYFQMLKDCVATNKEDPLAIEAGAWLEAMRVRFLEIDPHVVDAESPLQLEEYDQIRNKAARYIERLGPVAVDKNRPRLAVRLKDEAGLFRDKSIEQCIAAFSSDDVSTRRAAAWALFERGPDAAPAVSAIIDLLDDPDVRMPALHALDAIGPASYPASPKLAALMGHADGFVRLGAVYALGGMASRPPDEEWLSVQNFPIVNSQPGAEARAAVEPLRLALMDPFEPVVMAAGEQLANFGAYAKPALPEAIALLEREPNHPEVAYWVAGLRVIAGAGAEGKDALPKVLERYERAKGQAFREAATLAAMGPAAAEAIPVIEKYATPDNRYLADVYYALFCIRGQTHDLEQMVELLTRTDLVGGRRQKRHVVRFLNALGVKAASAADLVRELLKKDAPHKDGLRAYLQKVEKAEGPFVLLP
jgi:HEAT repeat protein